MLYAHSYMKTEREPIIIPMILTPDNKNGSFI